MAAANLPLPDSPPVSRLRRRTGASGYVVGFSLLVLAVVYMVVLVFQEATPNVRMPLVLTFGAIIVFALANLYVACKDRPFSLNITHWTFVLIFLGLAPMAMHVTGNVPVQADPGQQFGPIGNWDRHVQYAGLLALGWCVLYSLVYYSVARPGTPADQPPKEDRPANLALIVAVVALSFVAIVAVNGISYLQSRGAGTEGPIAGGSVVLYLTGVVLRVLPWMAFFILLDRKPRSSLFWPALVFCGLVGLILINPLNSARFATTAIFVALVCLVLRRRNVSGLWIPAMFLLVLTSTIPQYLDSARAESLGQVIERAQGVRESGREAVADRLVSADLDSFPMFVTAIQYVNERAGPQYGYGLASAALFFVPRNLWQDRSIGSPGLIADEFGLANRNLSLFLGGEGYYDFGMPGVFIYAALFAFLFAWADSRFWVRNGRPLTGWHVAIYVYLIAHTLLVLRGSLLAFTAYGAYTLGGAVLAHLAINAGIRRRVTAELDKPDGPA